MGTYKSGGLSRADEMRTYPEIKITGNKPRAKTLKLYEQSIEILIDEPLTNTAFNTAFGYYVSRFYNLPGHHDIESRRLAVCLTGMIGNSIECGNLRPWHRIISTHQTAGIKLIINEISFDDFIKQLKTDERYGDFISNWDSDKKYVLSKTHSPFIFLGVPFYYPQLKV